MASPGVDVECLAFLLDGIRVVFPFPSLACGCFRAREAGEREGEREDKEEREREKREIEKRREREGERRERAIYI